MKDILKKPEIKFGIIIGLLISVYVLAEYLLGLHTKYPNLGRYSGYFSMVIPIVGLYYAIQAKRQENPDKTISFKDAFLTGLIASAIAAAIISAYFYIYNTKINANWMDKAIQETRQQLVKEKKQSDKEINATISDLKQIYSPQTQLTAVFIGTFINGIIITLVLAGIAAFRYKAKAKTELAITEPANEAKIEPKND